MLDGPGAPAFAGVDTHKETNVLGLKDGLGRTIGTWEFPAGPEGYEALAEQYPEEFNRDYDAECVLVASARIVKA